VLERIKAALGKFLPTPSRPAAEHTLDRRRVRR